MALAAYSSRGPGRKRRPWHVPTQPCSTDTSHVAKLAQRGNPYGAPGSVHPEIFDEFASGELRGAGTRLALRRLVISRPHFFSTEGPPLGPVTRRGFTLVELVAVVAIIAVFATLSIPTVVNQLRDRRVQESARDIALVYRQARLRAMGRGSAVLVRFASGGFSVQEARVGTAGACGDLPSSSCTKTTWAGTSTQRRFVDGHTEATSGEMSNINLAIVNNANVPVTALEVCFTPMGRAFARASANDDAVAFAPLNEAYRVNVTRPGGTIRSRAVVLMPNGTARLAL
jgi:prepilin-type N-terminal cleavage/methylation domain-containing protein